MSDKKKYASTEDDSDIYEKLREVSDPWRPVQPAPGQEPGSQNIWAAQKVVNGGAVTPGAYIELCRIKSLPYPQLLTIDVESDITFASPTAVRPQGKSVFRLEIGAGERFLYTMNVGAVQGSPNPAQLPATVAPLIKRGRLVVLASSLKISTFPDPAGRGGTPLKVDWINRAVVAVGAATWPEIRHVGAMKALVSEVAQGVAAVTLMAAQPFGREQRLSGCFRNSGTTDLYLLQRDPADPTAVSAVHNTVTLVPGAYYELPGPSIWQYEVSGVWAGAGGGRCNVTETLKGGVEGEG